MEAMLQFKGFCSGSGEHLSCSEPSELQTLCSSGFTGEGRDAVRTAASSRGSNKEVKPKAAAAAAPVRFNLQHNDKWLPLSGPCKSNWRRYYSAVIGSFVHTGGLSKLISQLRAEAAHTLAAWTMGLLLMCAMPSGRTSAASSGGDLNVWGR